MAFGDEWESSGTSPKFTNTQQQLNINSTKTACSWGYFSLSQSLRLAFNSLQNIKTRMGGESKNPVVKTATKWWFALI